jgi:hypothetical protein
MLLGAAHRMSNLSHSNGKDNVADHPIVKQLQQDVAQINPILSNVHQLCKYLVKQDGVHRDQTAMLIAEFAGLKEQVKHVLDNTNRIIALLMPSQEP